MTTNFQKVTQFNTVLGQGAAVTPVIPSFPQASLRLDLINEEAISELSTALVNRDLVGVADAIGDALVVIYGAANDCGLDADAIMAIIHESNMSKLCTSEEDAQLAVSEYAKGGYHGRSEQIEADYRPAPQMDGCFVVFNKSTGKTLKGPNFFTPESKLARLIFPDGEPTKGHVEDRQQAKNLLEQQKMTMPAYWTFCESLDAIESNY